MDYGIVIPALAAQKERYILDDLPWPASRAQVKCVAILCRACVGSDRDARIALLERLVGHKLTSTKDLTFGEAHAIISSAYPEDDSGETKFATINPDFLAFAQQVEVLHVV